MEEDELFDMKFLKFANDPEIANYFFDLSSKALDQREMYTMGTILPITEMYDKNLINLDINV